MLCLLPKREACRKGFLRLFLPERERLCIVPAWEGLGLLVNHARFSYDADEAELVPRPFGATWRAAWSGAQKAALNFDGLTIMPAAHCEPYRKLIKFARTHDLAFDGETLRRYPDLVLGFDHASSPPPPPVGGAKIAVALHLHYAELWPEISALLRGWPFALFVSVTRADLVAAIVADFPSAHVTCVENRGRDVCPFLTFLEAGVFDPFDLVCKIHGKRSLREGVSPLFGELFRRATLLDLISARQVGDIVERFAQNPRLGLVGAERFRALSRHRKPEEIMGKSPATIESLAVRMGATISPDYDVFHGTMFWVRPQALRPLRQLQLASSFAPEAGCEDGALEHAVEGLFNLAVRTAGFVVEGAKIL